MVNCSPTTTAWSIDMSDGADSVLDASKPNTVDH
jgi:hypothetical protein